MTSPCSPFGFYTNICNPSALSAPHPEAHYVKVAYPLLKIISLSKSQNLHPIGVALPKVGGVGRDGPGVGFGKGMWCGGRIKALCLFTGGTVISGGRGEAWRCRPWILVAGCWWSPPTFPGTPHSGIYSQRCRSRSWAARRPSADTRKRILKKSRQFPAECRFERCRHHTLYKLLSICSAIF